MMDNNKNKLALQQGILKTWFKKMRTRIAIALGITTFAVGGMAVAHNNKDVKATSDKETAKVLDMDDDKTKQTEETTIDEVEEIIQEETTTQEQTSFIEETESEVKNVTEQYYEKTPEIESIEQENNFVVSEDVGKSFVENETVKINNDKSNVVVAKPTENKIQKETKDKNKEKETQRETKKVIIEDKTIAIDSDAKVENETIKAAEGDTNVKVEIVEKESTEEKESKIEAKNPFEEELESQVVTPEEAVKNKKNISVEISDEGTIDSKKIADQVEEYYK